MLRPRGNRGELIAEIYSSVAGRAEKLEEVVLEIGSRRTRLRVERVWRHDGRPVLKFSGIDSIGEAEAWAGADILVAAAERAQPGEGEFSHADLIGCRVIQGEELGTVTGVEDYGGSPLLRILTGGGREILIPFALAICREIDIASKTIRVELPEGLLDL